MNIELCSRIELALTSPRATRAAIERLCQHAREKSYRAVAVPSGSVAEACYFCEGSSVKVSALVGYPWGGSDGDVKRFETELAVDLGAQEIELFLPTHRLLEGEYDRVLREIRDVVEAADERPVKAALHAEDLGEAHGTRLADSIAMILDSGAQGISHGWASPTSVGMIQQLRALAGPDFGLKAAGALAEVEIGAWRAAGADWIGLGHEENH